MTSDKLSFGPKTKRSFDMGFESDVLERDCVFSNCACELELNEIEPICNSGIKSSGYHHLTLLCIVI